MARALDGRSGGLRGLWRFDDHLLFEQPVYPAAPARFRLEPRPDHVRPQHCLDHRCDRRSIYRTARRPNRPAAPRHFCGRGNVSCHRVVQPRRTGHLAVACTMGADVTCYRHYPAFGLDGGDHQPVLGGARSRPRGYSVRREPLIDRHAPPSPIS